MPTIVDHQITALANRREMISPFRSEQVNPASYDVRLGDYIKVETRDGWVEQPIDKSTYNMTPGQFVLAYTEEIIRIPENFECIFQLKSSRGREGYEHALAGYIDPGFYGQVTLELSNLNRYHSLPLYKGLLIGQLRFARLDTTPDRTYAQTGRYHLDMGAQTSKG